MSARSQRTANRSTFLAIGLLLVFFLVSALGDWEGLEGLALGLMIYFIALLHVPLGIVAVVAGFKSGKHWRNSWIYLYFGAFALVAIGYVAAVNEWGKAIDVGLERITDPQTTALRDALRRFDSDPAKALAAIEDGADVNTHDDYEHTPLMLAANAGYLDVVRRLLASGAEIDAIGTDGANALHFAAAGGAFRNASPREFDVNLPVIEALLDAGADASATTTDGLTPIIGACSVGSAEAVARLLVAGADPNSKTANGRDCITAAVESNQPDFIRWLLTESGAPVDSGPALGHALIRNRAGLFAMLLELGADPAALIQPRRKNSLAHRLLDDEPARARMRRALIDSGRASRAFNAGGANELREIITRGGDTGKLRHLLEMGVDPNATGDHKDTALHYLARHASGGGGLPKAGVLVAAGAKIDAIGSKERTPLGVAAHNGRLEMVEFLLGHSADVNYTDARGDDVLMLAAREGYGYVIEALAAADVTRPSPETQAAYFGASKKHAAGIRALLAVGLDPNHADEHGNLPLFDVIKYGDPDTVAVLIEGGASLDAFESSYSPLTAAADRDRDRAIDLLIEAGADPNAADRKGRTPLEVAIGDRAIPSTIALIRRGATVSALQRTRIEQRMLTEKYRGRGRDRKEELRALL